jgi:hypothetical protein
MAKKKEDKFQNWKYGYKLHDFILGDGLGDLGRLRVVDTAEADGAVDGRQSVAQVLHMWMTLQDLRFPLGPVDAVG